MGETQIQDLLLHFPGEIEPPLALVGGKGMSLIKLARLGMPVPPGFVLTSLFFEPWLAELRQLPEWFELFSAPAVELKERCDALKQKACAFAYSFEQRSALDAALKRMDVRLYAVRSSSPKEDLEGASFAGGYETILGVTPDQVLHCVRQAFASCLDYRVVVYKQQHGFDTRQASIAVIVQEQVDSAVAGVAFSLNPLTNDYDEAVINANWGLGETVVGGVVTPDTFVVNKLTGELLEKRLGVKETSAWLTCGGGTNERAAPRQAEFSLSDRQAQELTTLLCQVEQIYRKPIDIEWAYAAGKLHLLQARPITTYVPLPPDLVTKAGERRRLYVDASICAQGIFKPFSPMGSSIIRMFLGEVTSHLVGRDVLADIDDAIPYVSGGRIYLNASNALELIGKDRLADLLTHIDPLAAETIRQCDDKFYRSFRSKVRMIPLHALLRNPEKVLKVLIARFDPRHARAVANAEVHQHLKAMRQLAQKGLALEELAAGLLSLWRSLIFEYVLPPFVASRVAITNLRALVPADSQDEAKKLDVALPGNVTVEMGFALFHLAQALPPAKSLAELEKAMGDGALPPAFMESWQAFLDHFGHRGPSELDIAAPRFRDDPRMLLVLLLESQESEHDPQERYQKKQAQRCSAFEALRQRLKAYGWARRRTFESLYRAVENLGGLRETPKFCLIFVLDLLRQEILRHADRLVASTALDQRMQVFDLTFSQLNAALLGESIDLRACAKENRVFIDRLGKLPRLPEVIDSRGRILRASRHKEGEGNAVVGTPISPGLYRGRVKNLRSATEKHLQSGEILVARATDPGWTPLFVSAGAVILEVGGLLQHGALVAREYGLPCVGGVADVLDRWPDGTLVEVDGSAGIIAVVPENR